MMDGDDVLYDPIVHYINKSFIHGPVLFFVWLKGMLFLTICDVNRIYKQYRNAFYESLF